MGPSVSGWVSLARGQVSAKLMNFSFGPDVRSMLPDDVRKWWERHELSGRINIPVLTYTPARGETAASFRVETQIVDGVALTVRAEEWMGSQEVKRLERAREGLGMVRDLYHAGGYKVRRPPVPGRRRPDPLPADVDVLPSTIDMAASGLEPPPLKLENVAGKFVFTQDGVSIEGVSGRVDNNGLKINGRIEGYNPDAMLAIKVTSFTTENITIPASPRYISSLPRQVREFYEQLRPEGTCRLTVEVNRTTSGAWPEVSGKLDIINGRFLYSKFPYPLREVSGRIVFGRDPKTGTDRVEIQGIRGKGVENSANRNTIIAVDGSIGPLGPNTGVNVRVVGLDVASDESLNAAFPPDVRKALAIFDPTGRGEYPKYRGKFVCDIVRPQGPRTKWSFDTDVTLEDGSGKLDAFPYPLENIKGDIRVRTGHVDIVNATTRHNGGSLTINGRVSWGKPKGGASPSDGEGAQARADLPPDDDDHDDNDPDRRTRGPATRPGPSTVVTDLKVTARNVPIDEDLTDALPPERRVWLKKIGISGKLDIDGRIFQGVSRRRALPGIPPAPPADPTQGPPLDYDLDVTLHDGTVWPDGGTFAVTSVRGKLLLTPQSLQVLEVNGTRGKAEFAGSGKLDWTGVAPGGQPRIFIAAGAKNLLAEPALYAALPEVVRKAWDEVQPVGTTDVEITYDNSQEDGVARAGADGAGGKARKPVPAEQPFVLADAASLLSPVDVIDLNAAPVRPPSVMKGFKAVIKPRELSVMLRSVPYRLDHLSGAVTVLPEKVIVQDVAAARGDATVRVSGTGVVSGRGFWDLKLAAENLPVDDDLRTALPATLSDVFTSLEVKGKIGFDFPKFVFRGVDPARLPAGPQQPVPIPVPVTPAEAGRTKPASRVVDPNAPGPDVDLAGTVTLNGSSLDVGVPLTEVQGKVLLTKVVVRDGRPVLMTGDVAVQSMLMATRPVENFRADLVKPAGKDELRFEKMQARTCGGVIGGNVTLLFPDDEASRYALNLAVRNVDVGTLTRETEHKDMKGELTASLSLEGAWGAGASVRRGRGDVIVAGRGMYRVPVVLGLLQVTNLALPISGPFNEATARYSVIGERVNFESLELRSDNMVMSGDGHLDFGTKQVQLTFKTDNPKGLKVPFLNDLLQGARQEFLGSIRVQGTIQEPKVTAGVMGTFTTTVDKVLKGDAPPRQKKKK
jgi:hypothetical protein